MKVTVREEPAWRRILEITVDREAVEREREAVVEALRRELNLPGFRKGKVPKEIARKYLSEDLDGEVLQRVIPKALEGALREKQIRPIGDPRVTDLVFEEGAPLRFKAEVEVVPQIEITGYKGLKVTREIHDSNEEAVDRTVDALREERAELAEVDRPAQGGDVVDVRYVELDPSGEPRGGDPVEASLELGGPRTPDTFTEALMGTVAGDMKKIELPYPEDYPDTDLAGTTRGFHVTVAGVREKIRPALDDAFAREVMGQDDAVVDRLKEQIRLNHEAEAFRYAQRTLSEKILRRVIELNPFELPEGLVNSTLDRIVARAREEDPGLDDDAADKLRDEYRAMVENRYRTDLVVDTVANQEGIEVTDGDLDAEIRKFADEDDRPAAKIKGRLKKEGGLERLRDDLRRRRVIDRLIEHADVTDVNARTGAEENS